MAEGSWRTGAEAVSSEGRRGRKMERTQAAAACYPFLCLFLARTLGPGSVGTDQRTTACLPAHRGGPGRAPSDPAPQRPCARPPTCRRLSRAYCAVPSNFLGRWYCRSWASSPSVYMPPEETNTTCWGGGVPEVAKVSEVTRGCKAFEGWLLRASGGGHVQCSAG